MYLEGTPPGFSPFVSQFQKEWESDYSPCLLECLLGFHSTGRKTMPAFFGGQG